MLQITSTLLNITALYFVAPTIAVDEISISDLWRLLKEKQILLTPPPLLFKIAKHHNVLNYYNLFIPLREWIDENYIYKNTLIFSTFNIDTNQYKIYKNTRSSFRCTFVIRLYKPIYLSLKVQLDGKHYNNASKSSMNIFNNITSISSTLFISLLLYFRIVNCSFITRGKIQ